MKKQPAESQQHKYVAETKASLAKKLPEDPQTKAENEAKRKKEREDRMKEWREKQYAVARGKNFVEINGYKATLPIGDESSRNNTDPFGQAVPKAVA
jgi:hypothetical protein